MHKSIKITSLALILILWQSQSLAEPCQVKRAVFDVGSGSTKIQVSVVDICQQKQIKPLFRDKVSLGFMEALQQNGGKILPSEIISKGLLTLARLKNIAISYGAKEFYGVSTAAFRQAENGNSFVGQIKNKLGISLRVISNRTEAILGFFAVKYTTGTIPLSVWDIGGGSMQLINQRKNDLGIKLVDIGAVNFKNAYLDATGKDRKSSPNPLKKQGASKAINLAQTKAKEFSLDQETLQPTVYGIGGVHNLSIAKQAGKTTYIKSDIQRLLKQKASLADQDITSKFPHTEITNLAMVLGFMNVMQIESVTAIDLNLTDGLILLKNEAELNTIQKL